MKEIFGKLEYEEPHNEYYFRKYSITAIIIFGIYLIILFNYVWFSSPNQSVNLEHFVVALIGNVILIASVFTISIRYKERIFSSRFQIYENGIVLSIIHEPKTNKNKFLRFQDVAYVGVRHNKINQQVFQGIIFYIGDRKFGETNEEEKFQKFINSCEYITIDKKDISRSSFDILNKILQDKQLIEKNFNFLRDSKNLEVNNGDVNA